MNWLGKKKLFPLILINKRGFGLLNPQTLIEPNKVGHIHYVDRSKSEKDIIYDTLTYIHNNYLYIPDDIPYWPNMLWGDYWQSIDETISRKGGDCEDLSILLFSLLIANGVNSNKIRIHKGYYNKQGHVFCTYTDDKTYILESTSKIFDNGHLNEIDEKMYSSSVCWNDKEFFVVKYK